MTQPPSAAALAFVMNRVGCKERCLELQCDCTFVAVDCDAFATSERAELLAALRALPNEIMQAYRYTGTNLIGNGPSHQVMFSIEVERLCRAALAKAEERR